MVETIVLRRFSGGFPAPVDTAAMLDALRRLAIDPSPDGSAGIYAGDGGEAAIDLAALRTEEGLSEAQVDVELFTRGIADIVFDLASASGMTIAAAPGSRVLLTDGRQAGELPATLTTLAHTCTDGGELYWWRDRDSRPAAGSPAAPAARKEAVTRGDALKSLFGVLRRD